MPIQSIQPATLVSPRELAGPAPVGQSLPARQTAPAGGGPLPFGQVLGQELQRVNSVLAEADDQARQVATGQAEDLQQAMTAMAEADLALQVTMRVTQKAIAAYQEISRMQI
jgi:flagellar hook-basal body complex protein FliE